MSPKESAFWSLKVACLFAVRAEQDTRTWAADPLDQGDGGALSQVGPRTRDVSIVHGKAMPYVHRVLSQLHAEGRVIRESHPGWPTRWWPVGFADALVAHRSSERAKYFYSMPPLNEEGK